MSERKIVSEASKPCPEHFEATRRDIFMDQYNNQLTGSCQEAAAFRKFVSEPKPPRDGFSNRKNEI